MDFFKKQATSFLSSQTEKKEETPAPAGTQDAAAPKKEDAPSYQELLGSANVLLDAAKSQMGGNKEGKFDTAKLADAAEDVLQGASHYGKLEGTQYEGYVKKAEDYLQTYKSRDGADLTPPAKELTKAAEEVKAKAPEAAPEKVEPKDEVPDKVEDAAPKPSQEKVEAAPPKPSQEKVEAAPPKPE